MDHHKTAWASAIAAVLICIASLPACKPNGEKPADKADAALPASPAMRAQDASNDTQQIAEDAYLYGLQQVIFYGQRWTSTQNDSKDNTVYTGINRFSFVREKITPDFPIVTPNATTLYGSAYLDLQKEPLVLEMPAITDRYFSAQVMDQYGIFHTMVGNQRYAYDIDVQKNGQSCDDGQGNTGLDCDQNQHFFGWGEPLRAPADGTVVLLIEGNPDNPEPLCQGRQDCSQCASYDGGANMDQPVPPLCQFAPGAGGCNNQPDEGLCGAATDPCPPQSGLFPGSGNQVVLMHPSGEFTTFAHMMQGSNSHLSCGDLLQRGDVIGAIGMSGTGSNPHLHFSSLSAPGPEAFNADNFPMYFNNVVFLSPGATVPRRQLDTSLFSTTDIVDILPQPSPLPQNAPTPTGMLAELEPNDTLGTHHALTYPTTVSGEAENAEVGDLAVRGDGIEDVYRIDLVAADAIRIDLTTLTNGENLDVYVLDEELRVLNEKRQGTAPTGPERVCLELGPGAYYPVVTGVDPTRTQDADYTLAIESDSQTIACTVNGASPFEVDAACQVAVPFTIDIHDNCCLSLETLDLDVTASNPTDNAVLGAVVLGAPVVNSERDITVSGHVLVSDITSCPASVSIHASAKDCTGHPVDTTTQGTGCSADVIDTLPPTIDSSVAVQTLWPPKHDLSAVGLQAVAADNCDPNILASLETQVWGDEPEVPERGDGSGRTAPDAQDLDADLRLRAERRGGEDGRVYLMTQRVTDACGNTSFDCETVGVPHSPNGAGLAALQTQRTDAEAFCEANAATAPPGYTPHGISPPLGPKQ